MRHFLISGAVATLTLCVLQTATIGVLIAFSSRSQRLIPGYVGAVPAAIDITPVTVAADGDLAMAVGTVV